MSRAHYNPHAGRDYAAGDLGVDVNLATYLFGDDGLWHPLDGGLPRESIHHEPSGQAMAFLRQCMAETWQAANPDAEGSG